MDGIRKTTRARRAGKGAADKVYNALCYVRRYLACLGVDKIFTTRDLIPLVKKRSTLDSYLSRAVKAGVLERLTPGVFRMVGSSKSRLISSLEIAAAKRRAFAAPLLVSASSASQTAEDANQAVLEFATTGSCASFERPEVFTLVGGRPFVQEEERVFVKEIGNRKKALGETRVGRALREIWLEGRRVACQDREGLRQRLLLLYARFSRDERVLANSYRKFLPQWISDAMPNPASESLALLSELPRIKKNGRLKEYSGCARRRLVV